LGGGGSGEAVVRKRWREIQSSLCWRAGAVRSAFEIYFALGRRGRNGIHVYWSSLDAEEQGIYAKLLRAEM
jgi:hypothetical protein